MPPPSQLAKLKLEQLEARDVPALWAVGMTSPWTGTPGDTAATISGPLSYASQWPLNESGAAIVEAASASEAVSLAFAGAITVHCGAETLTYQMGPSAFSAAGPFRYLDGAIQLEDMAGSANGSDFDYNDHFWLVTTTPMPEGGGGGGTNPPPVPPPPTTPPVPPSPPATPTISISPFLHPTEGGIGQFNITRSTGAGALTVSYSTPTGTALEGSDYSGLDSNNRSVTFLENQTVVPVYFQAIDDTLVELPETVIVELNPVAGYTVVGGPATVTITDNDGDPPPSPPTSPPPPVGTGLFGRYYNAYNAQELIEVKTARIDATVNFDWAALAPTGTAVGADHFSVRWTGKILAQYSEQYTFHVLADDGVRLWINGTSVINAWGQFVPGGLQGTIALAANQMYDIRMEYYDNTGNASAKLEWASASQARQVVPTARLFPNVSTIGNRVWLDTDGNGRQDQGEFGVGNVRVRILEATDVDAVPATVTNTQGGYSFVVPAQESYTLQFVKPGPSYTFTARHAWEMDLDSDADATGLTNSFTAPAAGGTNPYLDAGLMGVLVDLDVTNDGLLTDPVDGVANYLPGYKGTTQVLTRTTQQEMRVIFAGLTANANYKVSLKDTSHYAGIALNAESDATKYGSAATDNDFVLVDGAMEISIDGTNVGITADGSGNAWVKIRARDFGGRTTVVLKDANDALVSGGELKIPLDKDDNKVADAATQNVKTGLLGPEAADDNEGSPVLNAALDGDRLYRFDEYRGFFAMGKHVRTSVVKKTVFVSNETGYTPKDGGSLFSTFQLGTGFEVVELKAGEFTPNDPAIDSLLGRVVNSFGGLGIKNQRVIVVEKTDVIEEDPQALAGAWNPRLADETASPSNSRWVKTTSRILSNIVLAADLPKNQEWLVYYKDDEPTLGWVKGGRIKIGNEVIKYGESFGDTKKTTSDFKVAVDGIRLDDKAIFAAAFDLTNTYFYAKGEVISIKGVINKKDSALKAALPAAGEITEFSVALTVENPDGEIAYLKIGDEWFSYTKKEADGDGFKLTGVKRAQRGSVASAHALGDTVAVPNQYIGVERGFGGSAKTTHDIDSSFLSVNVMTGLKRNQASTTAPVEPAEKGISIASYSDVDAVYRAIVAHELTHATGFNDHVANTVMAKQAGRGLWIGTTEDATLSIAYTAAILGKLNAR